MRTLAGLALSLFLLFSFSFLFFEAAGWMGEARVADLLESVARSRYAWATGPSVVLLLVFDLAMPVPSSIVMLFSGRLLGTVWGSIFSFLGAMGSALLGFGLCRRYGRSALVRLVGDQERAAFELFLERHGPWAILLSRPVPMATEVISCLAGLGRMSWLTFTALNLAGALPICVLYAWAGSREGMAASLGWSVLIAVGLPALGYLGLRLWKLRLGATVSSFLAAVSFALFTLQASSGLPGADPPIHFLRHQYQAKGRPLAMNAMSFREFSNSKTMRRPISERIPAK